MPRSAWPRWTSSPAVFCRPEPTDSSATIVATPSAMPTAVAAARALRRDRLVKTSPSRARKLVDGAGARAGLPNTRSTRAGVGSPQRPRGPGGMMPRTFRLLAASLVALLAMAGAAAARPAPRLASVKVTGIAPTSVSVAWRQPRSGRAGVELFVNGRRIAVVHGRRFTFGTLSCATQYRLTLRARYLRGRRSARVRLFVTTAP